MKLHHCGRTFCPTCKLCVGCDCDCYPCPQCKSRSLRTKRYACQRCQVCRRCCECRNSPKYLKDSALYVRDTGHGFVSRLPRTIGIELEISDWNSLTPGTVIPHIGFDRVHDWSVKPSEQEMVLQPMRRDAFPRGMLSLSRELFRHGCTVNETCALHVHIGGKDLSYWEIRRLLEVYLRIEPEIYSSLIAPHRLETTAIHYCQRMTAPHDSTSCPRCARYDSLYPNQRHTPEPLERVLARMRQAKTTADLKVCLLRMLYGLENPTNFPSDVAHRKGGRYEFARYFGLNLHSWMYRLTVEWRMKEATTEPMELVCWPLWCGWVTHAITKMSDADSRTEKMSVRYLTDRYMPKFLQDWIGSKGL